MKIAIKENNILRNISAWDNYDFVNKGMKVTKFEFGASGKYEAVEKFYEKPYLTEPPYNFQIIDIDVDGCDVELSDFDNLGGVFFFNAANRLKRINAKRNKTALTDELNQLEDWFVRYDSIVAEHNRCMRLNIGCAHDIEALDREAAVNQNRIHSIRVVLNLY